MKELPLIFSAPMVRAVLEGRKTMTRRLAPPRPQFIRCGVKDRLWVREAWRISKKHDATKPRDLIPRSMTVMYEAGGSAGNDSQGQWTAHYPDVAYGSWVGKLRPSIFMPRWASRITLEVTGVKVERLNDITDEDAIAEGVVKKGDVAPGIAEYHVPGVEHPCKDFPYLSRITPREMFAALWDAIHGSGAWLKNPEVVAISFKRSET